MEEATILLDEASVLIQRTGAHSYDLPLECLRAKIHLSIGALTDAEACFLKVLDTARRQKAKLGELRAATGLALLWHSQGKREEQANCSPRSTTGSPKDSRLHRSRRPRHSSKNCPNFPNSTSNAVKCIDASDHTQMGEVCRHIASPGAT
jgi:hypothetical protein